MDVREKLVELFYDNNVICDQKIEGLTDDVMDIVADVAPVRHGRWIEQDKYTFGTMYDCSICGDRILDNGHSWNYCPNCGAKMDEVSK